MCAVKRSVSNTFVKARSRTLSLHSTRLTWLVIVTSLFFVGIFFEERDLVAMFGDDYRRYKQRVSMLVPWRYLTRE